MSDVQSQLYYNANTHVVFGSNIPQTDPDVKPITAAQVDDLKAHDGAGVDESALPLLPALAAATPLEEAMAEERGDAPAALVEANPAPGAVLAPAGSDTVGNVSAAGAAIPSSASLGAGVVAKDEAGTTDPLAHVKADATEGDAWFHAELLKVESAFEHGLQLGRNMLSDLRRRIGEKL